MRIGMCGSIENIARLQEIGYDYLETGATGIASVSKEKLGELKAILDNSEIKCEAFNCFFPGNIKIVGPDVDNKYVDDHIKLVMERAGILGVKHIVVGSGNPRRIPEGYDFEKGIEEFAGILAKIGNEAANYGITAVIEPLNKSETNVANSVLEGLEIVKKVNHPNIQLLADFYHMAVESDSIDNIIKVGQYLKHTHISSSKRAIPADRNEDNYSGFFQNLKAIGYKGGISIEAAVKDLDAEAPVALKLLRELAAE